MNDTAKSYFMNIHTGSVDTWENWMAEDCRKEADTASLFPVRLADETEVPADFNPSQSSQFDWEEVN